MGADSDVILLLESVHPAARAVLEQAGQVLFSDERAARLSCAPEEIVGLVTRGRGQVSRELLDRLPALRVVGRCGVGLDNVDLEAAAERGIVVLFAPGSTTAAAAEHTMLLMLASVRRLCSQTDAVRAGRWQVREEYTGDDILGKRLGVVGLGAIGTRVAELAQAFGMHCFYWSRSSRDPRFEYRELDELMAECDIVSLHLALEPETRGLISAERFARMEPGSFLINTARGGLVDRRALLAALEDGTLAGYGADTLETEPPDPDDPLLAHDRVLLTPHIAALTTGTYRSMCLRTAYNVVAALGGGEVEPESLYRGSGSSTNEESAG